MDREGRFRRLLRLPGATRSDANDAGEEIEFHLGERIADLVASGIDPAEARRRAEAEFGDVAAARVELAAIDRGTARRERLRHLLDALSAELRTALRGLRRSPGFSASAVVALGLGIGVNAAMFGIADRVLLSPPPHVADADHLVRVLFRYTPRGSAEPSTGSILPYADYTVFRDGVAAFHDAAAYQPPFVSVLGRGEDAVEVQLSYVTGNFFHMLGVTPAAGRFFVEEEDVLPRGARVVVLAWTFWRSHFGGDPGVIGSSVEIDHARYRIVGVAPEGFTGVDLAHVDMWSLASAVGADRAGEDWAAARNMHWLHVVARLDPAVHEHVSQQQATAAFLQANEERFADDPDAVVVLAPIIAARGPAVGVGTEQRNGRIALWLLGVSLLVLLIACANVANLLLTRGLRRTREVGVQVALGAGRGRLALQVVVETAVLGAAGLALGLLLADWGGRLARTLLLPDVHWVGGPVGRRVFVAATLAAGGSALLAALMPAFYAMRVDAGHLLRYGGRATRRRSRVRTFLIAFQAAISVVLLAGAGLFVRSLQHVASIPLGFDATRVAAFTWWTTGLDWDAARERALYDTSLERARALPLVESAALGMTTPMWSARYGSVRAPGRDSIPAGTNIYFSPVSEDYFRTLGSNIVRGRPFTARDGPGSEPVLVVTESLATLLWPGRDPLGECLVVLDLRDDVCRVIVGVVENVRYSTVEGDPTHMFYLPMAQGPDWRWHTLFVRLRGDPDVAVAQVRRALLAIEPSLPHVSGQLLRTRVDPQLQPWRLGSLLFSAFGVLALVMAALGLYSVVAYDVAQRRREFGLRMALGARTRSLMALVLRDAGRTVLAGLLIGLAVAGWAGGWIEPLLFDVGARDPAVLAAVTLLLLAVALLAAALPAMRGARVNATEALREE